MKLWPAESFVIETCLQTGQIVERLEGCIVPQRSPGHAPRRQEFEGSVDSAGFVLKRVIYSVRSFVPELHGSLQPHAGGTRIAVAMIPGRATLTILAMLFALLIVLVFERDFARVLFILIGYSIAAWVIALLGFWLDGGQARRRLLEILRQPIEPSTAQWG